MSCQDDFAVKNTRLFCFAKCIISRCENVCGLLRNEIIKYLKWLRLLDLSLGTRNKILFCMLMIGGGQVTAQK